MTNNELMINEVILLLSMLAAMKLYVYKRSICKRKFNF